MDVVNRKMVIETIENSYSTPNKQIKRITDHLSNCVKYLPSVDCVTKEAVIDLIQNYYFAPFATTEFYEERKLLLDNICTAIRCMPQKDGDKNG